MNDTDRLALAVFALNTIASWKEGKEVTSSFDEPNSAKTARLALKAMNASYEKEYDDLTSTLEEQKTFEAGCLERLDILTKSPEYNNIIKAAYGTINGSENTDPLLNKLGVEPSKPWPR